MSVLAPLARLALIGTAHQRPEAPAVPGAAGALLNALFEAPADASLTLLRAAGVAAVCGNVGHVPMCRTDDALPPCPDDAFPSSTRLAWLLGAVFANGPDRLIVEALRRLISVGLSAPPQLLPALLTLGQRTTALRDHIGKAAGARGQWLAALNPAWGYFFAQAEHAPALEAWETDNPIRRLHTFTHLRRHDPAAARNLLIQHFPNLDARERAALLETFSDGLSADDEAFITQALTNRSKEVRQTAAALLARRPDSTYVARMTERLAGCLTQTRKLLRREWVLEPPTTFDTAWKADALEEKSPLGGLGERAGWLYQIARAVPLAWWEAHTGMTPSELFAWADKTDWAHALHASWFDALQRERNATWAAALLRHPKVQGIAFDPFALIGLLADSEREWHWRALIKAGDERALGDLLARLASALPLDAPPLSAAFAEDVLNTVRRRLSGPYAKHDYALRNAIVEFVCLIPPASFDAATQNWPLDQPNTEFFAESVARLLAVVEQRKALLTL